MWPYINFEDLTKTKALLLMLHFRGRHQPHEFVHSDLEQARLGETSGATMPKFLNGYTMLFADRNAPKTYGQLVSWDDDDTAFDNMMNGVGMHPGHGLQALEIQERIWAFLVKSCLILLQDISSMTESDVQPNPGPPVTQDRDATSLETISFEAPYRIPAKLEFDRLKALASAERNWREDHLWSLREDPAYFAETMHEQSEHRLELLLDTSRREHPALKEPGRPLFWNRVIGTIVGQAYFGFATFDEVLKQVNKVASLHEKHKTALKPEKDLPADLLRAIQDLRFLLGAAKTDLVDCLKLELFGSPPLRQFCDRDPQDPKSTRIRSAFHPPKQDHPAKRFVPFFNILLDEEQLRLFGLHTWTDEIEHLIRTDPAVAALVSPRIASRLSSLSVVSECLQQLHLFQPWARKIEDSMDLNKDKLKTHYNRTFQGWRPFLDIKLEGSQLYKYADPTDGKFDCPMNHRRNKQSIEMLRKAEANLDAFWEAVDQFYRSKTTKSHHDVVADLLRSDRAIQRTLPWEEPDKKKAAVSKTSTEYLYKPFSSVYHDASKEITGNFERTVLSEPSTKLKTRGHTTRASEAETSTLIPHEAVQYFESFAVDKRAYKVFKALFHSPSDPNQPGEVPWVDFLHAMVAMGFSAEKLHGSAWNFTPRGIDLGVERSIQFHEPHPSNKIPFRWARRYGRRLGRAYGWGGEIFRLV